MAKFTVNSKRFDPYKSFKFLVRTAAIGFGAALVVNKLLKKRPTKSD